MDTSTFTYQIVANVLVNFASTTLVNIPITGNATNHCAVVLALTGTVDTAFMPHIVVQTNNVQVTRYHPSSPSAGATRITARILVMKFRPSAGAAGPSGSYGFLAINDSGYVQIDAETPRLSVLSSGTYQGTSMTVTVAFPQPITTQEPPCVFIRPSTSSGTELYYGMSILGSAGNWTGFRISTRNVSYLPSGKWFAAVFAPTASATYGVRIWNGAAARVYDSGAAPAVVTNVVQSWTYVGSVSGTLAGHYYWRASYEVAADEYVMINPFTLPALSSTSPSASPTSISLNYAQKYAEIYQQGPGGTVFMTKGNVPAVFARLFIA
ncbi:hypothetical protein [Stutzerimonas kunmingensis]|uniref:hypothetical protein n=1 Tax=Stutzerimonas kunmingensis TaxID=1211807 RepID=UPI002103717A|nr:hypothetical protein [Stutzerimonas kunmingensis]MCQ2034470.1 hypothetical protein [Stutzerimonas kunmingensis]